MTDVAGRVDAAPAERASSRLRRLRAPVAVAAARLRAHPGRSALVAAGVAAAVAALAAVAGGSLVARDRAVQRALATLPASQRSFRIDAFGLPPGESYASADRIVRSALAPLASRAPLRGTFFRELRIDHELVQLAALDGLGRLVRLRSGRLPRQCTPARCEVLQVGGRGAASLDEGGIHLARVGVAEVPGRALFGDSLDTVAIGGDRPVLLLASGARSFDGLPALDGIYRAYSWIAPIEPKRLHAWAIGDVLARETRAQVALARRSDLYRLDGPDAALLDARSEGRASAQRMLVVGGECAALLLGFALVAAVGLRRGLGNEARRLLQRGARRSQVWVAAVAEIAAMTLAGALVGAVGGVAAVAVTARLAGLPAGAVLRHSVGTPAAVAIGALVWAVATSAVVLAARAGGESQDGRRLRLLDVAALGAAGAAALGLARGGLDAETLATGGDRTLLLLLPGLVCLVAAVLAGRLVRPLARAGERLSRAGPVPLRLALLALSRSPARTTATAAFLVVALGLALFAASWRATLGRGARDEAAFAVPLDVTLTAGPGLVQPFEAASPARYRALAPGVEAYPVLRRPADVAGPGTSVLSPTVLGLPPAAVARLHWRSDFAAAGPGELARRLDSGGPVRLRALPLPAGAREASLRVRVRGVAVHLDLALRRRDGGAELVPLGGDLGPGTWRLQAAVPADARAVLGMTVSLAAAEQVGASHRDAEAEGTSVASGTAELGPLVAGGRVVTDWAGLVPRHGLRVAGNRPARLSYAFDQGQTMLLRLPQPTDGHPLAAVVSPDVARAAGPGGLLTLDLQGTRVPARVVAVARRFPAAEEAGEGFAVVDESRLATALDADAPGSGAPGEAWLSVPSADAAKVSAALRRPPLSLLAAADRRAEERRLASDPLARGIALALAAGALVALALALAGFWISLVSELRDERGELFDLEAQGVAAATLRRQFRIRAVGLAALGLAGGVLLGLVLSRLVVSAVRVSATTAAPEPPLALDSALGVAALGALAFALALVGVVEAATRLAFRGGAPARAPWSLE